MSLGAGGRRRFLVVAKAAAMVAVMALVSCGKDEIRQARQAEPNDVAELLQSQALEIVHGELRKALRAEYGEEADEMISPAAPDDRLSVLKETWLGWKETEGGKRAVWIGVLRSAKTRCGGCIMINDSTGDILRLLIPTRAGKQQALRRVEEWFKKQGRPWSPPAKIEWQDNDIYVMHWPVSEHEMALLGPFTVYVHTYKREAAPGSAEIGREIVFPCLSP